MAERSVKQTWTSLRTIEGAGVHLRRALGFQGDMRAFDPFLLMDDFRSENPADYEAGFPWHPHRGMETITYVLDGEVEHGDSMKNRDVIRAGDVQWMSAGGGIIHQEMPKGDRRGRMAGFQLWANMPAKEKMSAPRYRGIKAATIPLVKTDGGATARIIAGEVAGVRGAVTDIAARPEYLDVNVPAGSTFTHEVPEGNTVLAYVIEGEGRFGHDEAKAGEFTFVHFGPGTTVTVKADKPVRFLLVSGKPLNEPIAWMGPIVMNTQEELDTAFREFQEGTFLKHTK
jgi:redox-sensitive bicupin YhaK (pirin superfamily)